MSEARKPDLIIEPEILAAMERIAKDLPDAITLPISGRLGNISTGTIQLKPGEVYAFYLKDGVWWQTVKGKR